MKKIRRWWWEYNVEIIGSLILHGGLALMLASSKGCLPEITQPKPVTKINIVTLGSIKKSKVPDRASRKERSSAPKPPAPSEPKADTTSVTPPKPSQMTVPKEQKQEPKEKPKETPTEKPKEQNKPTEVPKEKTTKPKDTPDQNSREELIRKTQREQLLKSLQSAPVGPKDREATSQEGTDKTLPGMPSATPSDPILAQYVSEARAKIIPNWAPLPTLIEAHPEYEVIIQVEVLANGSLRNPVVIKKSGDASFDAAAIRAIYKTVSLPPPPEKWKASAAQGILITLAAADKT
jgi:TonB family protein